MDVSETVVAVENIELDWEARFPQKDLSPELCNVVEPCLRSESDGTALS